MWVLTWWIGTCLCFFRIVDGYVLLGALGARIELWISQFLLSASPQWSASAITSLSSNFTKAGDLGALIVTPPGQDRRTYWAQHFSIWTSSRARSDLPGSAEQKNRCVLGEKKCAFAAKKSVEKQDFRSALEVHKTGRRQKMHQTGRSFQFFFDFKYTKPAEVFFTCTKPAEVLRNYQFCAPTTSFACRKLVNFSDANWSIFLVHRGCFLGAPNRQKFARAQNRQKFCTSFFGQSFFGGLRRAESSMDQLTNRSRRVASKQLRKHFVVFVRVLNAETCLLIGIVGVDTCRRCRVDPVNFS